MKTSLKKLLQHRKHDRKDRKILPLAQVDELAKASKEMEDMRDCYDSLLSAAAGATNSAYEFSESLREFGVCLLQKIAVDDDEDTGQVMLMLGKVQFELQKLVDIYRSHIYQTITIPSDSLINELHIVEEMKHQCDEKRELYEYMRARYRERGRLRSGNGESFSSQQIQVAKDEFDEEATLFVFRLKSLKQGQSRSLLTQAARHHAAQLSFFRKTLKALEEVEPHVKLATQQQHIDYQFSGLEDDESEDGEDTDDNDEDDDSDTSCEEGDEELSFDYQCDDRWQPKLFSASRKNMEESVKLSYKDSFMGDPKMLSRSAPLLPQQKSDPVERIKQLRPSSTRKFHSYVLPKPGDPRSCICTGSEDSIPQSKPSSQLTRKIFHSCPLEQPKKNEKSYVPIIQNLKPKTPPPLTEKISSQLSNHLDTSYIRKPKPHSFSGPLLSKPFSARTSLSIANPIISTEPSQFASGPILRNSIQQSFNSPKASPRESPTFNSSPSINELHELPRPPPRLRYTSSDSPLGFDGFSGPLLSRSSDNTNKSIVLKPISPLPAPDLLASTPSTSPKAATSSSPSKYLEAPYSADKSEENASPPLTPLFLSSPRPT